MGMYMVSYDLSHPDYNNNEKVKKTIQSYEDWCHYLDITTYVIKTSASYEDIRNSLSEFLIGTDRLVIYEIPNPEVWVTNKKLNWRNKTYDARHKKNNYKLAISSKTGENIDEHFGHTDRFYIYSYDENGINFIETRKVYRYGIGVEECSNHDKKISKILETVEDCDIVLTLKMGVQAIKKLEQKGIKVIQINTTVDKGIEKALEEIIIMN